MFSVNEVKLIGNVTRDPELRYTPSGTAVLTINLATNRSQKDESSQSGWKDVATFHKIVAWGKLGERTAQNVSKGDKIYIDGRIDNRSYDAKDGTKKYISEVVANNIITFKPRGATKAPSTTEAQTDEANQEYEEPTTESKEVVNPDDIPF